jgi:hypothetical protein
MVTHLGSRGVCSLLLLWALTQKKQTFTQTNDGVMMCNCWALRWTTVTDSEWSSPYLSALLWQPYPPDRVVLEVGPPSSLSSSIVDWRPGYKHNYILFLWSFSVRLFTAFREPAYCRSLLFIAALSLNEGKDLETQPSVYYKQLITITHTECLSASNTSAGEPKDRYAHYEELILWGFLSCWTSLTDDIKLTSSWRLDRNHIPRSGPLPPSQWE